jgi:hypothetical protein
MKDIAVIILLFLVHACGKKVSTMPTLSESMYLSALIDPSIAISKPYELSFDIEKTADDQYTLVTNIKLHGGSFFVSPHSTRDFKGKFTIETADNDMLKIGHEFKESPRSEEVIDPHPFVNGPINWVKEDTRYDHPLVITSQEDFDMGGKIFFTI